MCYFATSFNPLLRNTPSTANLPKEALLENHKPSTNDDLYSKGSSSAVVFSAIQPQR